MAQRDKLEMLLESVVNLQDKHEEKFGEIMDKIKPSSSKPSFDKLSARLGIFRYNLISTGQTFDQWFGRHAITLEETKVLEKKQQVELVLQALGEQEYRQLCGSLSPKKPTELNYEDLVKEFKGLFCDNRTLGDLSVVYM